MKYKWTREIKKNIYLWLNSGRTIPVHTGQKHDPRKLPEAAECGWTGAAPGEQSCQLLPE